MRARARDWHWLIWSVYLPQPRLSYAEAQEVCLAATIPRSSTASSWSRWGSSSSSSSTVAKDSSPPPPACIWSGVNPTIVFVFALFGLLFDLLSLFAFKRWGAPFSVRASYHVVHIYTMRVIESAFFAGASGPHND